MNNDVKQLLLADGQSIPQEGFGLYKIIDQSTITSAIKIMPARYVENGRHVRHTAKEVDGDYGSSSRRDFAFDVLRVNV